MPKSNSRQSRFLPQKSILEQEGSLSGTASLYWQLLDSLNHLAEGNLGHQKGREVRFDFKIEFGDLTYLYIFVHIAIFIAFEATTASIWPKRPHLTSDLISVTPETLVIVLF